MKGVWTIFRKELLSVFRDRRYLLANLVLPVFLMPVFVFGPLLLLGHFVAGAKAKVQEVAVASLPQAALQALEAAGLAPKPVPDPEAAVRLGDYPVGVSYREGVYRVYARLGPTMGEGTVAVEKVRLALAQLKEAQVAEALRARGLDRAFLEPFRVEVLDASPERERAGGLLGFLLPFFLVVFVLSGGQGLAVEATAGEKEKGTLEALLVTPLDLRSVVLGKTLATVAFSLLAGISGLLGLALGGLVAWLFPVPLEVPSGQALDLGGRLVLDGGSLLALLVSALLLAFLMGTLMVGLGLYARSFKEAQSYMVPLMLVALSPMIFLQFSGFLKPSLFYYLLPFFNLALLMDALFKGSATLLQVLLAWGSALAYALLALALALWVFAREEVVFRN